MALLKVENVYKRYSKQSNDAVNGISFEMGKGELLAVVGESGSGKTTLLKLIGGLEELDEGKIYLNGNIVTGPSQNLIPGHPDIKIAFQDYRLFPNISVYQNIAYALRMYQKSYQQERTEELLQVCKLWPVKDKLPKQLSGGEQQRAALARALADEPLLLLMDEPFSNVDVLLKHELKNQIAQVIKSADVSAIFVTHDTSDALSLADRIAVMKEGQIIQLDTPQQIYTKPLSPYIARFFGTANIVDLKSLAIYLHVEVKDIPLRNRKKPLVCIRAEDIQICEVEESQFTGKVTWISYLGGYLEVEVLVGELSLILRSPVIAMHIGEELPLQIMPEKVHFFPEGRSAY